MQYIPLIYDLLFLLLFAGAAVRAWRRGLLASVADLIGLAVGMAGGVWATRTLAPALYAQFIDSAVTERVAAAVADSGGDAAAALQTLDFLPQTLLDTLSGLVQSAADNLPRQVADTLEPLLLPLVQAVLFVVLCTLIRWVFRLLTRALRGVNFVPVLGGLNRVLGLVLGLCVGALDCVILAMVLWLLASVTAGKLDFLTLATLSQSTAYAFFGTFNPFLVHY